MDFAQGGTQNVPLGLKIVITVTAKRIPPRRPDLASPSSCIIFSPLPLVLFLAVRYAGSTQASQRVELEVSQARGVQRSS